MGCCFVYLACAKSPDDGRLEGPVKFGVSENPASRLSQLQTGNARPLVMAVYLRFPDREAAALIEVALQEVLAADRLVGEWFNISPQRGLAALCCNVRSCLEQALTSELLHHAVQFSCLDQAEMLLSRIVTLETENG